MYNTLSIASGKALTIDNTLTFSGNDGTELDFGAWESYTPIVSSSGGAFTSVNVTAHYKKIGKTVVFQMSIQMVSLGSASGTLYASLPIETAANCVFVIPGRETANTGKMCQGYVGGNETDLWINYYDNTTVVATGNLIFLSGVYQSI